MSTREVQDAGRGVLLIAGAKIYFMLAGGFIVFSLPNVLDEATYGAYLIVAGVPSVVNNVMVTGTIKAVARFTAQTRAAARAIQAAGFRMHLFVGLPVAIAFAAIVAPVMGWFLKDPSKVGPIAFASFIVAGYAFYATFVGTANGLRAFHKQAGLDVLFATLRAAGIVGMAALGFGVQGAIGGWIAAVAVILAVSAWWIGLPGSRPGPARSGPHDEHARPERRPVGPIVRFFFAIAVYLVLLNLLMFIDLFLLKRLTVDAFVAQGLTGPAAAAAADTQVGYYGAAQQFARLSYQAIIAATFVIFPLISRTTFDNERDTTVRYIRATTRYSFMFAGAFATVFAANPHAILDLPFRVEYADHGARPLIALALGNVAFAMVAIIGAILNGAGKTRHAAVTAAVTVIAAGVGNLIVIPRYPPGPDALFACAVVTASAMVLGMLIGGALLSRALGGFIPWLTVVRTLVAGATAVALGSIIPLSGPLGTLVEAAIIGLAFLAVLALTRELTGADLRAVKALRSTRSSS